MVRRLLLLSLLASLLSASSKIQEFSDFTTPLPIPRGDVLIIGFVGGWERWDNEERGVRKTALELRAQYPRGVHVETVENHKFHLGRELIRRAFDWNGNGVLDLDECRDARVIFYGQSLGGSSTVRMANELNTLGISVLLTVQVDSVGIHDREIPPNVKAAANLYQRDAWFVKGTREIHALDPSRTRILANDQFHYRGKKIVLPVEETWLRRTFLNHHINMELDPVVWSRVKAYVADALRR